MIRADAIFPKGEAWAQLAAHTVKTKAQNNLFPDTIPHCLTHEWQHNHTESKYKVQLGRGKNPTGNNQSQERVLK